MQKVNFNKSPQVEDIIIFPLKAGGADERPQTFNSIQIYFIEKEVGQSSQVHENKYYTKDCVEIAKELEHCVRENPDCKKTKKKYNDAKQKLEDNAFKSEIHFKDLLLIHSNGSEESPLWEDERSTEIERLDEFTFEYEWNSCGVSPGDYIVSWSWTNEYGEVRSQHLYFDLDIGSKYPKVFENNVDTRAKYRILMERYLPRMFRYLIHQKDVTPKVIRSITEPVGIGFAKLEDNLLSLMEVYDVKSSNEYMLQILANMFGIQLRSDNDYLWRRQIKNAISLNKKKGTEEGLREALEQAAIKVNKITRLWQVMSECYWCESFKVRSDYDKYFTLSRNPINNTSVEIELRAEGEKDYVKIDKSMVHFTESLEEGNTIMFWRGFAENGEQVELFKGDHLRIRYPYRKVEDEGIEEYIHSLPLADDRDEAKQDYPIKNYNMRLIEEDDPLFDTIIKERHPFVDPVVYGKIRTTFGYSENVYNMDTYNGSLRDSTMPCHIDKDFLDTCNYGQSSKFNIDLEISDLCDMRIKEAREIIEEYKPFHALIGTMTVNGLIKDYIIGPMETISVEREETPMETLWCLDKIQCVVEYDDGKKETIVIGD